MKLGNAIVQNMFGVSYPVLALEHLWVVQLIIQRLKMLAPIVHIQTTKGAQVLKLDMALQTCCELFCEVPSTSSSFDKWCQYIGNFLDITLYHFNLLTKEREKI